ncbi:hypothetical protein [Methylobacterium brachiatum]|uniref:hypothetical protein n=1 Tax=Methylobacterium brachiatum TaxID=269660 RepID=UPI0008F0179D|nr:hypothetical protein [Methylobacterium brachiatum]SFI85556.1 hypothetical protein SAMN02799642_02924 [Methylobacterium brachiatum]
MDTGRIGRQQPEPDPPAVPPAPDPAPAPDQGPGNVVVLGSRLTIMPSPGAVERGHLADEVADDLRGAGLIRTAE